MVEIVCTNNTACERANMRRARTDFETIWTDVIIIMMAATALFFFFGRLSSVKIYFSHFFPPAFSEGIRERNVYVRQKILSRRYFY